MAIPKIPNTFAAVLPYCTCGPFHEFDLYANPFHNSSKRRSTAAIIPVSTLNHLRSSPMSPATLRTRTRAGHVHSKNPARALHELLQLGLNRSIRTIAKPATARTLADILPNLIILLHPLFQMAA
jgi:hypothetical protein